MKNDIFLKNKIYSYEDVIKICNANTLVTVDCLKDENIISVEGWDVQDQSLSGTCLFEFEQIETDQFLLKWAEEQ